MENKNTPPEKLYKKVENFLEERKKADDRRQNNLSVVHERRQNEDRRHVDDGAETQDTDAKGTGE